MIKLKQLIKEETIHSCECGGDCCSVNESKGMELGKIFTGHGFAFKKEELEDESCGYTDEIGIEEPELEEGFEKYHLGNLLDSKLKKRLERAIKWFTPPAYPPSAKAREKHSLKTTITVKINIVNIVENTFLQTQDRKKI